MNEDDPPQPVSITRAVFQSAANYEGLSSDERRRRRAESRNIWLPPGLVASQWVVTQAFRYEVGALGSGEEIVVGRGFEFDGASVPPPLTLLVPQTHALYLAAAALHDWLYQVEHERISRKKADAIFREAMIVLGLNWFWAGLMWRSVRAGGWVPWHERKPGTLAWRLLRLPKIIRGPLIWLVNMTRGFAAGLFVDLFSLPRYRAEAARIRALDAPKRG
ncbi:MAG: DUF1353 domain-containing protein [Paracoccaceae bacterium]